MRETLTWCDKHFTEHDERVPAAEITIGADNRWYGVELCTDCVAETVGAALAFMQEFGVRESDGIVPPTVIPTRAASRREVSTQETLDFPAAAPAAPVSPAAPGDTTLVCWLPGCGVTVVKDKMKRHVEEVHHLDRSVLTSTCPACGEESKTMNFHVRKAHDATLDELYRATLEAGDPDGRVAALLEKARRSDMLRAKPASGLQ